MYGVALDGEDRGPLLGIPVLESVVMARDGDPDRVSLLKTVDIGKRVIAISAISPGTSGRASAFLKVW